MSSSGYYIRVSSDGRRYAIFRWFSPWGQRCVWFLAVLSKGEVEPDAVHDAVLYFNILDGDKDGTTVAVPENGWKGMSTFSDSLQVKHVKREPVKRPRDDDNNSRDEKHDDRPSSARPAPLRQPGVKTTPQQFDPRDCRYIAPATGGGGESDQGASSSKRSKYEPPVGSSSEYIPSQVKSAPPQSPSDQLAATFARMIADMCGRDTVSTSLPVQVVEQFEALRGDYSLDMPTTLAVFRLVLDCLGELQRQQARAQSVSNDGRIVSQLPCEMPSD
eukprot:gene35719-44051_t